MVEDLLPICAAQAHRWAESKVDGNFWRPHFHVWPGSIASGKHRHGRWDLVLPFRSRIKTAIDGMVFTDFPVTTKSHLQIPRSKHLWLPSLTTKASSIRNLFLQVKPLMLHFSRQFWTDCKSVSGRFGQSYTGLENGCCSIIMTLHTVWSVCINSWLRR